MIYDHPIQSHLTTQPTSCQNDLEENTDPLVVSSVWHCFPRLPPVIPYQSMILKAIGPSSVTLEDIGTLEGSYHMTNKDHNTTT